MNLFRWPSRPFIFFHLQTDDCLSSLATSSGDLTRLNNDFCTSLTTVGKDHQAAIDLFAQLCRLVVDMCNVPLIQPASFEDYDFNEVFCSSGHTVEGSSKSKLNKVTHSLGEYALPEWLACLVAGSTFAEDFNLKSVCLHTLLDLVHASISIHGWDASGASQGNLLLPVLTPDVLSYLAWNLNLFSVRFYKKKSTYIL